MPVGRKHQALVVGSLEVIFSRVDMENTGLGVRIREDRVKNSLHAWHYSRDTLGSSLWSKGRPILPDCVWNICDSIKS